MSESAASLGHPAPHRHKTGLGSLLFGFWGGPIAWIAQETVNYGLTSQVCYPGLRPRIELPPGGRWIPAALFALDAVAVLLSVAAAIVAYRAYSMTRQEVAGGSHQLLEIGEGRSRFLSLCGLITAAGFCLIILFNTLSLALVPLCAR